MNKNTRDKLKKLVTDSMDFILDELGDSEETVECKYCKEQTSMVGTKTCDDCWELATRIKRKPTITQKILKELAEENK